MKHEDISQSLRKMNLNNSEFDKFDKRFNSMFKWFVAFFLIVLCGIFAVWGTVAYLAVTKGPEAFRRAEHVVDSASRTIDAYADKLEQENKNKKSE